MPTRAIRIANCSGAISDPGRYMLEQAREGPVDAITGDYLAEFNLATNAEAMKLGNHPGYEKTGLDGFMLALDVLHEKKIKVVVNAGGLNPKGLAEKVQSLLDEKQYDDVVAWVEGDNLMDRLNDIAAAETGNHLDANNKNVETPQSQKTLQEVVNNKQVVSANAYIGARGITKALQEGAQFVICGRCTDASPVIGLSAWWHNWSWEDYDRLAGALIAGHLIECSAYVTGGNFSGAADLPFEDIMDIGYGIAEISHDGTAIITKHESLKGVVNEDTVRCQLLYELQGNIYLNSDVIADIKHIKVNQVEKNRVQVSNVAGFAPPSTTKLAVFYRGGFTFEYFVGATGLDIDHKIKILEAQLTRRLKRFNAQDKVYMEIQTYGKAQANATNQLASTTITRIYFQAEEKDDLRLAIKAIGDIGLQHFAGKHGSLHKGSYAPQPIVTYFPALIEQSIIQEKVHFVKTGHVFHAEGVSKTIDVIPRNLNESTTTNGVDISKFGPTTEAPLGRIAYTRSGDKGGNANVGIFVHSDERYDWLRSYMTTSVFSDLLGEEKKDYWVERVEFPEIKAIHFVVYGILGDGVSSTSRLDNFAKSFGEYVRQKWIPIPDKFLEYNTFAAHL